MTALDGSVHSVVLLQVVAQWGGRVANDVSVNKFKCKYVQRLN